MRTPSNRWVGIFVVVVAFCCFAQLLYFSYVNRRATDCQADVNQVFLATLKSRASIADGDKNAIQALVTSLFSSTTKEQRDHAVTEYYDKERQLDALRTSFQYPDVTGECR